MVTTIAVVAPSSTCNKRKTQTIKKIWAAAKWKRERDRDREREGKKTLHLIYSKVCLFHKLQFSSCARNFNFEQKHEQKIAYKLAKKKNRNTQ